jgi:6-phosphogluconolactonase (cycloisomerase 2 family)
MGLAVGLIVTLLAGCGGGSGVAARFQLGGTVSGLVGSGLVISDSNGAEFKASSNGAFSLPGEYSAGSAYSVSVSAQPISSPAQYCAVGNASGTFGNSSISDIAVTCHGPFVYLVAGSGISANTIDVNTGALLPVRGSPFSSASPSGAQSGAVVVDAMAKFAYLANAQSDNISVLTIDAGTGALAPVTGSPFAAGAAPQIVAIHPSGKFLYSANYASGNVSGYAIDASTGALTQVAGSPFPAGLGAGTGLGHGPSVLIDPSGSFAYVINAAASSISAWRIDATSGALSEVPGSPFATGPGPGDSAMDARGRFLYVLAGNGIDAFSIDPASGTLTSLAGSPYSPPPPPGRITIDPTNSFVYVVCTSSEAIPNTNVLASYAIDSLTGQLYELPESPLVTEAGPQVLTFAPAGAYAYLDDVDVPGVAVYAFDSTTGVVTYVNTLTTDNPVTDLAFERSGKYAYGLLPGDDRLGVSPSIQTYGVNGITGALVPSSHLSLQVPTVGVLITIAYRTDPQAM